MRNWPRILFFLLILFAGSNAHAFYIHLYGVVTDHFTGEPIRGVQVLLVKDSIERETITTNWNGRYEMYLERGYAYEVHFKGKGMVRKFVSIDAREIPLFPDVPFFEMDLQISMFEQLEGFDVSAFEIPVGKAEYKHSVRNLNWNVEYTRMRADELKRVMIHYERELEARRRLIREEKVREPKRKRKMVHF